MTPFVYPPIDLTGEPTAYVAQYLFYRLGGKFLLDNVPANIGTARMAMRVPLSFLHTWRADAVWPIHMMRPGYRAVLKVWARPGRWLDARVVDSPDIRARELAEARLLAQYSPENKP